MVAGYVGIMTGVAALTVATGGIGTILTAADIIGSVTSIGAELTC